MARARAEGDGPAATPGRPLAVGRIRGDVRAVRKALGYALKRRATYPGAIKEIVWSGVNVALYPAGLIGRALEPERSGSLGGRYSRQLPFMYLDPEAAATPIIMLHGYFHNRSGFMVMRRSLRKYGYRHVDTMNYNVVGHDIEELAAQLAGHVEDVLNSTGASKVHLIGHSTGGLVARAYVQELGGADKVHTCITLGTPHGGTYAAWFGRGRAARQMRPRSELLDRLDANAREIPVRFLCYYSNLDALVVPASAAKLMVPELKARNVFVKDLGHMSLLASSELIRSVAENLSHLNGEVPEASITRLPRKNGRSNGRTSATSA